MDSNPRVAEEDRSYFAKELSHISKSEEQRAADDAVEESEVGEEGEAQRRARKVLEKTLCMCARDPRTPEGRGGECVRVGY